MKISKNGINLIKDFEGYHKKLPNGDCTTYYCPAGVLTIGYGCTEGIRKGEVWTHEQAINALKRELKRFEDAVNELVKVEINQNQFDALVSFAYNCGSGALSKSTLLKKVNAGDFDGAARQFGNWTRGGGRVLPGLVRRRTAEAELFQLKPEQATEPRMAQAVDAPKSDAPVTGKEIKAEGSGSLSSIDRSLQAVGLPTVATIIAWILDFFGFFKGTFDALKTFVADHKEQALLICLMVALGVIAILLYGRFRLLLAARQGRYVTEKRAGKAA